jgi:hypothetical protein
MASSPDDRLGFLDGDKKPSIALGAERDRPSPCFYWGRIKRAFSQNGPAKGLETRYHNVAQVADGQMEG